jgi:hypothetical protein
VLDRRQLSSPIQPLDMAGRGHPAMARAILCERPFVGKVMLRLDTRDVQPGRPQPSFRCITTKLAKVTVIIHRIGDARGFDVHVPRSLAQSLWAWLAEAGRDRALPIAASSAEASRS